MLWPTINKKPVNEKLVARLEDKMIDTLDLIENIWLKNNQYLCGDEISISDIIAICEIDQPSNQIIFHFKCNLHYFH